jgi:CubicO group peptidase (beta-lactamase class C family)
MIVRTLLFWLLAAAVWTGLFVVGTIEGWWRTAIAPPSDTRAFFDAAGAKIAREHRGPIAFVLLERGRPFDHRFASIGKPVDADTRFQVASLSKWITAWGVMALVEDGKIDLDVPVSTYLKRWKLPPSQFDNNAVTVRRLLSHTAGLTDGLGYGGFKPGEPIQTLEQSLTRAADASPGADGAVRVGIEPGSTFEYSGGGYTLLQLLIEDVTGQNFNDYMRTRLFDRLGMSRSTFIIADDDANIADFLDTKGAPATHYRFAGLAAASLYTTANDLTLFLQAHVPGPNGEPIGRSVLSPRTLEDMRRPHASQFGADIWGLGTILYAPNKAGGYIIGHDGNNDPAINTAARIDPATGDGIIVLESGSRLLATTLAGEWIFWNTGNVDFLTITIETPSHVKALGIGLAVTFALALLAAWLTRRRSRA